MPLKCGLRHVFRVSPRRFRRAIVDRPSIGSFMSIDTATVVRIARLARLPIEANAAQAIADDLSRVLDLAGQLAEAALTGVEPMAHPHAQTVNWRADAVIESDRADALLALAPDARAGLYTVPKVIG
jgi:aspartyl-tRNA(Asn)/glutamyl-tRNA(Gln) amidotransferase subunit C